MGKKIWVGEKKKQTIRQHAYTGMYMYLDSNHGHLAAKQTTEPHVQKYCKLKNFITVIMIRQLILKKLRKCVKRYLGELYITNCSKQVKC